MDTSAASKISLQSIKKNYSSKQYKHFDEPLSKKQLNKELSRISNPKCVVQYRHLPFISFDKTYLKYSNKANGNLLPIDKRLTKKKRKISLSSHHDSLLLKYYSNILNVYYEQKLAASKNQLQDSVIAYRSGKSNISGSKSVFDFIWKTENCWIIKGDFKHFFDNLNHKLIFESVKNILEDDFLSDDWYSVLKFITSYRSISQKQLKRKINHLNSSKYTKNKKELGSMIKTNKLKLLPVNKLGIPQGTSLSAIIANVYMYDFDNWVLDLIKDKGIYRRYSDDFVIILPKTTHDFAKEIKDTVIKKSKDLLELEIETHKTKLLYFDKSDAKVYKDDLKTQQDFDYLGFAFNGKQVYLRSKSLYKFHTRGKHSQYILRRDLIESKLVREKNKENIKHYVNRFKKNYQKRKVKRRLTNFFKEQSKGINLQSRKKHAHFYLSSNIKDNNKTMLGYAVRAQKQLSVPIPGINSMYAVNIENKIRREIGNFGKAFHDIKNELNQ